MTVRTDTTAYARTLAALRDAGKTVTERSCAKATAQCPAHDDGHPSLSVTAIDGSVLLYCHANCATDDVLAALGMSRADLYDDRSGATYPYPGGRVVRRTPAKSFRQSGDKSDRSLFHADRIADALTVFVVEGEKDVLAIEAAGGCAVSPPQGASTRPERFDWTPLRGKRVVVVADKDEPGRAHARRVAALLSSVAASVDVAEAAAGKDAADHIAANRALDELVRIGSGDNDHHRVTLTRLSDVQPETTRWLWQGRIPLGKLVTLDGDPGLGKSTLALDTAATVTRGGTWPDGTRCAHPGDVLLLSAEDGLADTVRPRLDAAGADVQRVHAIEGIAVTTEGDGTVTLRPPTVADVADLEDAIRVTGARLLIVDVLMAYLPNGADSHKDQDIRRVLSRLSALADRTGCTVLLLRHLNKAKGGDPLYRGGGSIGIVGAARAGLLVAADPDDEGRRVLATVKSNLGPSPDALAYRLVGAGPHGVARVQWEGTTAHTARSLLSGPSADDDGGALTEAEQWVTDYLESQAGAALSKDVKVQAAKAGIRERTLQRAVKSLGLVVDSRGFPRVTWWQLPSRASEANGVHSTPATQNLGATGATGDDQRKQIGATGPDRQSRQARETGATGSRNTPRDPARGLMREYPTGPGRCRACGFHVPTQGHRDGCRANGTATTETAEQTVRTTP